MDQSFICVRYCRDLGLNLSKESFAHLFTRRTRQQSLYYYSVSMREVPENVLKRMDKSLSSYRNLDDIIDILKNPRLGEDVSFSDHNRRLACTTDGYLGWIPKQARVGDRVCLLQVCPAPFIVRRHCVSDQRRPLRKKQV